MEDTITITLHKPLQGVTEISLRMPTVDEVAQLSTESGKFGAVRALKNLIAKISQVEVSLVGQMGARDFKACQRFIDSFRDEAVELLEGDSVSAPLSSPLPGLAQIALREPTLDEISRLAEDGEKLGSVTAMRNLIAKMNKAEPKLIGSMGLRDFKVCEKYLEGFFE